MAALDLEIRGAGNLLGGEQSGHIEAVGFEMYMKLLEQTVRELKGEELEDDLRATVNLRVDLRIDGSYVQDMNQRLMLYRKVAAARREEEIDRVLEEAADRYGPLPDSVLNLADYGRIRNLHSRTPASAAAATPGARRAGGRRGRSWERSSPASRKNKSSSLPKTIRVRPAGCSNGSARY